MSAIAGKDARALSLDALEGRWRIARRIEDRRAGTQGTLVGEAVWSGDGAGSRQVETGVLRLGAARPMQARRVYLWRAGAAGALNVCFEDGRPFHRLVPGAASDRHLCGPDIYDVTYDLGAFPDVWHQRWSVMGPRKEYTLSTRFWRG